MKIGRQTLWSFIPIGVSAVGALASIPLYLRFLGPDEYAVWLYVASMAAIVGFADLGIAVSAGKFFGDALGRKDDLALKEYWGTAHLCQLVAVFGISIIFTLVGILLGPVWFQGASGRETTLQICFFLGGAGMFINFYTLVWNVLFQAHLDFSFPAIIRTLGALCTPALGVLAAWITRNPTWVMAFSTLPAVLAVLAMVAGAKRRLGMGFGWRFFSWSRFHEMKGYTAKILLNMIFSFAGGLERIIAGRVLPAPLFAYYNISLGAGSRFFMLGQAVMSPVFHNSTKALAEEGLAGAARVYEYAVRLFFPWVLHAICLFAVWTVFLTRLWLGENHQEINQVFFPLIAACLIGTFSLISSAQLPALDRVHTMSMFQLAHSLLCAGGVYLGWKLAGFPGVAWGFLASRIVSLLQDLWTARHIRARGIWSFWGFKATAVHSLIALLFATLIHQGNEISVPTLFALFLLHALIFPVYTLVSRVNVRGLLQYYPRPRPKSNP